MPKRRERTLPWHFSVTLFYSSTDADFSHLLHIPDMFTALVLRLY